MECEVGHTTNGSASDPVSFEVERLASGVLGLVSRCMPAECGSAQDVNHSPLFGETVAYTCHRGHSVDFTEKPISV